jgi:hypothetical protein
VTGSVLQLVVSVAASKIHRVVCSAVLYNTVLYCTALHHVRIEQEAAQRAFQQNSNSPDKCDAMCDITRTDHPFTPLPPPPLYPPPSTSTSASQIQRGSLRQHSAGDL